MALPAPILSGPSILYLGLAAHKYSNKVHLSEFLLQEMPRMKWRESRPHSRTGTYICVHTLAVRSLDTPSHASTFLYLYSYLHLLEKTVHVSISILVFDPFSENLCK